MVVNVISVQYNGGHLPDIILLTVVCDYIDWGTLLILPEYEELLSLQPIFPPKYFDNFSPEGGCSESLDKLI